MAADAFTDAVENYYRHIDAGRYDRLDALLVPSFTHYRPDRTFEGAETFVSFMRDDRPRTDTVHHVDTLFAPVAGATEAIAVAGRLTDTDGTRLFRFVDLHERGDDDRLAALRTYTQ